jgi:hypothetical protein
MPAKTGCGEPAATAPTSGTFGGLAVTIMTPAANACVANGKQLNISVSASGKHAHAKFKSAQFFIDKGIKHVENKHGKTVTVFLPNATAHHAPVSLQIPISGLSSGIHMLTVKLTLSRKIKGRAHLMDRMLRAYFTVC